MARVLPVQGRFTGQLAVGILVPFRRWTASVCAIRGHVLGPEYEAGASGCTTRRECRRCGQVSAGVRHGRPEVIVSANYPSLRVLRCPRCGYEYTQWMVVAGTEPQGR